jgi:hypothetical protein
MKWFLGRIQCASTREIEWRGHLFAGRYKSLIVDDHDASYLRAVTDYVHLNAARADLAKPMDSLDVLIPDLRGTRRSA